MTKLHEVFLPYSADLLRRHFLDCDAEGEDPERHLERWRRRIAEAPRRDASFLYRDETLWTAGTLLAVHRGADARNRWLSVMTGLFGPTPPIRDVTGWSDLLAEDLALYFEVGLPSPASYRQWLSEHLGERQVLPARRAAAEAAKPRLEGRTQLDALLLSPTTGFAVHFEAKVLSDIDPKTTYDSLRNQLARNIDCMAAPAATHPVLGRRDPERSFFVLLTPELFRRNSQTRLYGHLLPAYAGHPEVLHRDLPHLDKESCAGLSPRLGWLTFEDIRALEPDACPWLTGPPPEGSLATNRRKASRARRRPEAPSGSMCRPRNGPPGPSSSQPSIES